MSQAEFLAMAQLLLFLLAAYGLANAVTLLHIGQPLRWLVRGVPIVNTLTRCPACAGFWIGILISHFAFSPSAPNLPATIQHPLVVGAIVDGLAASGFSYLLYCITEKLDPTPPEPWDEAPAQTNPQG